MECRIFSAMMIGPRSRQEDCITDGSGVLQADLLSRENPIAADRILLAVCDGMGGHQGGEKASHFACQRTEKFDWPANISGEFIQRFLLDLQSAAEQSLPPHSGTTFAGIAACGDKTFIFNAGDSRVYKITDESIECLSHDHSLVQDLVDQHMMNAESASMHPLKHMIDFGIGPAFKHVWSIRNAYIKEHRHDTSCAYLLCTDGLTDIMSDAEIHRVLAEAPVKNGARLVEAARKKGLTDNTSFIIARIWE
ncbi:MAG: protein phosphatase 2C domain-containing protein [Desulfobacteraceae bacterium]|nr:protein phosphatase 2C domain-containing protein [Desulfobacteraceae bacterium]MCF8094762.1 protein phosphatase 2C domain-containing protein [Desulfobacteraceae bacterium]